MTLSALVAGCAGDKMPVVELPEIDESNPLLAHIIHSCGRKYNKNCDKKWRFCFYHIRKRYDKTKSDKDYRALMNAIEMYDMNIREMTHSKFCCYHPESTNYDLYDNILEMLYDWCL